MASNRTKRNIYGAIAIVAAITLVAMSLAEELCNMEIDNLFYYIVFAALFSGCLCYSNFRQSVKEDEKYGKK